jgi:hypothetical protein
VTERDTDPKHVTIPFYPENGGSKVLRNISEDSNLHKRRVDEFTPFFDYGAVM